MSSDLRACEVLSNNDMGGYTVPTKGLYPYQWNWDSVFVSLGFATFDKQRAWAELDTLFEAQWPDGMLPHIVFREDAPGYFPGPAVWQANKGPLPSSGISQPPVAATIIRKFAQTDPERARGFFEKLNAWHEWWHWARDPDGKGVMAIIHPWEAGRDNLPDWDKPGDAIDVSGVGEYTRRDTAKVDTDMRPQKKDYDRYMALVYFARERDWDQTRIAAQCPFFVADPGISSILLRAEKDLLVMARDFDQGEKVEKTIEARIDRLAKGMELLWNPLAKAYVSRDLRTGEQCEWATSASFLPLYAGVEDHKDALLETLSGFASKVRFLVPSFDPDHAQFDHIRYWRGPCWAIINYMIARGLEDCGAEDWCERIRKDTADLIRAGGFAEYFSPLDGRGCGGDTFSWTAAIWLAWGLENETR